MITSDDPPNIHVAGVPLHFPYAPYRAQNALMHAVVSSVRQHSHALIESPTGTGKSLALLCSSLAIQNALAKEKSDGKVEQQRETDCPLEANPNADQANPERGSEINRQATTLPAEPQPQIMTSRAAESDDSDFAPCQKFRDVSWQRSPSRDKKRSKPLEELPENSFMFERLLAQKEDPLDEPYDFTQPEERRHSTKVPRVFYATRTHNQVAQVVDELRKTVYRPRIAILASRGEYCIKTEVRTASHRDEICKGLVKGGQCQFFHNAVKLAEHEDLRGEAWDIEELTELGKKHGGCPYYASHQLYQNAQLILCPYSFLIDPIVRKARGINVSGDIVILDEAHNIENCARDAAGFKGNVADMRRASDDVDTLLLTGSLEELSKDLVFAYRRLKGLLECFMNLADAVVVSEEFRSCGQSENAIYEGQKLIEKLTQVEVLAAEVKYWRASYEYIANFGDGNEAKRAKGIGDEKDISEDTLLKDISTNSVSTEEQKEKPSNTNARNSASYGYGCDRGLGDGQSPNDESPEREPIRTPPKKTPSHRARKKGRRRRKGRAGTAGSAQQKPGVMKFLFATSGLLTTLEYLFENADDFVMVVDRRTVNFVTAVTVQIHCLNAAVCFREISDRARSVIVTSGTLSPINSFVGELGTRFGITKTLPHVINVKRQIYVGVVAQGPRGVTFDATFQGSAKFSFQDSLGDALIDYCKIIPGGVLVFFPSYRMMDQLCKRWQTSGAWQRLQQQKQRILVEPNKRGQEFDAAVAAYLEAANCENGGAVMMGVCRGKFSEGIDFRDNTSRAVILIGIPFPYKGDVVVSRKKLWNDRIRMVMKRKDLQSGMEWYETQAFRALNQALGRAVRHRYDYGAILLVDSRFRARRMMNLLPAWTRQGVQGGNANHASAVQGLEKFFCNVQGNIAKIADADKQCRGLGFVAKTV